MSFLRLSAATACAASLCLLSSCETGGGKIEAVNPTVAEMDQLDVQWGLQPRRARGNPRRSYAAPSPSTSYTPAAPVREPVTQPAPAPASIPPVPPQTDSATINSLR